MLLSLHKAVLTFAAWGWPILLVDLAIGAYDRPERWANALNTAAFFWVLSAPVWPITLVIDRRRREDAMSKLCGLREGDERERAVTGDAARSTLLLSLALQTVLLVLTVTSVKLVWNPELKGEHKGLLSVAMGFSTTQHLDPFGTQRDEKDSAPKGVSAGGYLISPACFPLLALLILIQLAAFRAYAGRRYEGAGA